MAKYTIKVGKEITTIKPQPTNPSPALSQKTPSPSSAGGVGQPTTGYYSRVTPSTPTTTPTIVAPVGKLPAGNQAVKVTRNGKEIWVPAREAILNREMPVAYATTTIRTASGNEAILGRSPYASNIIQYGKDYYRKEGMGYEKLDLYVPRQNKVLPVYKKEDRNIKGLPTNKGEFVSYYDMQTNKEVVTPKEYNLRKLDRDIERLRFQGYLSTTENANYEIAPTGKIERAIFNVQNDKSMNPIQQTFTIAGLGLFRDIKYIASEGYNYGKSFVSNPTKTIKDTGVGLYNLNKKISKEILTFTLIPTQDKAKLIGGAATTAAVYTYKNPTRVAGEILNIGLQIATGEGLIKGYRAGKAYVQTTAIPKVKEYYQVSKFRARQQELMKGSMPYINIIETNKPAQAQKTLFGRDISKEEIRAARASINEPVIVGSYPYYTPEGKLAKTGKIEFSTLKGSSYKTELNYKFTIPERKILNLDAGIYETYAPKTSRFTIKQTVTSNRPMPDIFDTTRQTPLQRPRLYAYDLWQDKQFRVTSKTKITDTGRYIFSYEKPYVSTKPSSNNIFITKRDRTTQSSLIAAGIAEPLPSKTREAIKATGIIEEATPKIESNIIKNIESERPTSKTTAILEVPKTETETSILKGTLKRERPIIQYSDEIAQTEVKIGTKRARTNIFDIGVRTSYATATANKLYLVLVSPPQTNIYTDNQFNKLFRTTPDIRQGKDIIFDSDTKIDTGLKQDLTGIFKFPSGYFFGNTGFNYDWGFITPPPIPPPKAAKEGFLPDFSGGSGKTRLRAGKQKFRYTPSVEAILFNIKGKAPTRVTGLELRPIRA